MNATSYRKSMSISKQEKRSGKIEAYTGNGQENGGYELRLLLALEILVTRSTFKTRLE